MVIKKISDLFVAVIRTLKRIWRRARDIDSCHCNCHGGALTNWREYAICVNWTVCGLSAALLDSLGTRQLEKWGNKILFNILCLFFCGVLCLCLSKMFSSGFSIKVRKLLLFFMIIYMYHSKFNYVLFLLIENNGCLSFFIFVKITLS